MSEDKEKHKKEEVGMPNPESKKKSGKVLIFIILAVIVIGVLFFVLCQDSKAGVPEKGWNDVTKETYFTPENYLHSAGAYTSQSLTQWMFSSFGMRSGYVKPLAGLTTASLFLSKQLFYDGDREGASWVELGWGFLGQGLAMMTVPVKQKKGIALTPTQNGLNLTYNF